MRRGRGPAALAYRAGTYRSFLSGMIRSVRRDPRLQGFNAEAPGDFTTALMGAWARVCDILTFYQERIANEGYLGTAEEPLSVLHLAGAVGARRRPATSARTHLAFQLMGAAGRPDRLMIDRSNPIAVQNAPEPGAPPVIFECSDEVELRSAWNAIPAAVASRPHKPLLWPGCRSLLLSGTDTGAKAGAGLLLRAAGGSSWFVVIDAVQIDRRRGCTLVTWRDGIPSSPGQWPRPVEGATLFTRSAGLFGRSAAAWSDVPAATKEALGVRAGGILRLKSRADWRSAAAAAPPGKVRVLLPGEGVLLAGTDRGLFGSSDGGDWSALPLPPGRHDVHSLLRGEDGRLYAGTGSGSVLASADGGDSWTALPQGVRLPRTPPPGRHLLESLHLIRKHPVWLGQWPLTTPIRALVLAAGGDDGSPCLYAGTDKGVFVMPSNGLWWRPFNGGDFPGESEESGTAAVTVTSMVELDGRLAAVTDQGLFATGLNSSDWKRLHPPLPLGAAVTCATRDREGSRIFLGTTAGVFVGSDGMRRWEPFRSAAGPPVAPVSSIAAFGDVIAAATPAGVHVSPAGAPDWRLADLQDLLLFETGAHLIDPAAADPVGQELRERFLRFGIDLDERLRAELLPEFGPGPVWEVRELSSGGAGRVFRLRPGATLEVSQLVWAAAGPPASLSASREALFGFFPPGPVLNTEWPDFTNSGSELVLDRTLDRIAPGSALVVQPNGDRTSADPPVYRLSDGDILLRRGFGKQATVTRLVVDPEPRLPSFDPRTAVVHAGECPAAAFTGNAIDFSPVAGAALRLSGSHGGLLPGRWLQVSGPRAAAVILEPRDGSGAAGVVGHAPGAAPFLDQNLLPPGLKEALANGGPPLSPDWTVTVVEPGAAWLVRDRDQAWQIDRMSDEAAAPVRVTAVPIWEVVACPAPGGARHWIFAAGDARRRVAADDAAIVTDPLGPGAAARVRILWQAARSDQKPVTEVARIANVAEEAGTTAVTFDAPLTALYDSAACRVCANLALATHGQSVVGEVLGSGSSARASQHFRLSRGPLTYLARPGGGDAEPVIEVEVDGSANKGIRFGVVGAPAAASGTRWKERRFEAPDASARRVYALSADETGAAILSFGDGAGGARLPTGSENVTASYRAGAGSCGNVPAGSLIALRKNLPGIRAVTNPVAAADGSDAETIEALRERAPRRLRRFDRLVTAEDYRAAATETPGVKAALVEVVEAAPGRRVICVTCAANASASAEESTSIRSAVFDALKARRAGQLELHVLPAEWATFDVRLAIEPLAGADPVAAERAVFAALFRAFGSDRDAIGKDVRPEDLVEIAGQVQPVAVASVLALHRRGEADGGMDRLVARRARPDVRGGRLHGAELLVIGGIEIEVRQ